MSTMEATEELRDEQLPIPHPLEAASNKGVLPSRKLAVWLFLGSEILFFSALIFTYIVVRLGSPLPPAEGAWPIPLEIQGSAALFVDMEAIDAAFIEDHGIWTLDEESSDHALVAPDEFATHREQGARLVVPRVLNIPLTALNTFLLILSSVAVVIALNGIQRGDQKALVRWLSVTLVLGVVFLGIQAWEYLILHDEGLWIDSIPHWLEDTGRTVLFGTTFFAMTGFHGMHVFAGVIMLAIVLFKARRELYSVAEHEGVELFGLYWHFVDLVWIILFTIVYLI